MAKTALDLTVEELRSYRPDRKPAEQQMGKLWEEAWEVARAAAHLLRERFGVERVAVFGSLAHREYFNRWSDIDIVAWDIPPDQFYRAVAAVTGISSGFQVNLAEPECCRPSVLQSIEREGIDL